MGAETSHIDVKQHELPDELSCFGIAWCWVPEIGQWPQTAHFRKISFSTILVLKWSEPGNYLFSSDSAHEVLQNDATISLKKVGGRGSKVAKTYFQCTCVRSTSARFRLNNLDWGDLLGWNTTHRCKRPWAVWWNYLFCKSLMQSAWNWTVVAKLDIEKSVFQRFEYSDHPSQKIFFFHSIELIQTYKMVPKHRSKIERAGGQKRQKLFFSAYAKCSCFMWQAWFWLKYLLTVASWEVETSRTHANDRGLPDKAIRFTLA